MSIPTSSHAYRIGVISLLVGISLTGFFVIGFDYGHIDSTLYGEESSDLYLHEFIQDRRLVYAVELDCSNPNHVLVQRSENRVACVYESTAQKLGWEIILPLDVVPTDVNYWMPNPDEDIGEFAKKFAAASGVTLSDEVDKFGVYKMNPYVSLSINHLGATMRFNQSDVDPSQSEKFVRDFMDYMEFEYAEKDFHKRPSYGSYEYPDDRQSYWIANEHSSIRFNFYYYEEEVYEGVYYDKSTTLVIGFSGWTNHPELIVYTLSEDKFLQYANEFSKELEANMILLFGPEDEDSCTIQKNEKINYVNKKVIKGIPYYISQVGLCVWDSHDSTETAMALGMFSRLMLHQDAVNGTDVFIKYGPSGE